MSIPVSQLLGTSTAAYLSGTVLGQIVRFNGEYNVHKVSLDMTINRSDRKTFIVGENGVLSWSAANFQISRDDWIFQPIIHWASANSWVTSGTSITNLFQSQDYPDSDSAVTNAPYLKYSLYFPDTGVYDLWGYGYTESDGFFWSLDDDITHLRTAQLGSHDPGLDGIPRWTKFGSILIYEAGLHSFSVYLGTQQYMVLDQWYFTTNYSLVDTLTLNAPLPVSVSPFTTAVRLRSISDGQIEPLDRTASGSTSVTSWKSSIFMIDSGKFNYAIRDNSDSAGVVFTNGLCIEYWQIGGGQLDCASWNYSIE